MLLEILRDIARRRTVGTRRCISRRSASSASACSITSPIRSFAHLLDGVEYADYSVDKLAQHITDFSLAALKRDSRVPRTWSRAMNWIALKMLTGNHGKYLGIILGIAFASLLIAQQASIFCGLMLQTSGQIRDIQGADIWVMDPNVQFSTTSSRSPITICIACAASRACRGQCGCTKV